MKIRYINLWKSSQFQVCYLVSTWSSLEKIDKGTIFWSIHHILAWFFSKMCFVIGLIAPGCCYTHNVIIYVATSVICEKACIEEGAIFRLFQTCWKLSSYMTGLNTCVRKLCELDALVFQITNWLMHKYYRRLCYRGNNSCFLSRSKATGYLDY